MLTKIPSSALLARWRSAAAARLDARGAEETRKGWWSGPRAWGGGKSSEEGGDGELGVKKGRRVCMLRRPRRISAADRAEDAGGWVCDRFRWRAGATPSSSLLLSNTLLLSSKLKKKSYMKVYSKFLKKYILPPSWKKMYLERDVTYSSTMMSKFIVLRCSIQY